MIYEPFTPPTGMVEIEVPDPDRCPVGVERHTWKISIELGEMKVVPVEKCTGECTDRFDICDVLDGDLGRFRIRYGNHCTPSCDYQLDGPCDCDHGWQIEAIR